MMRALKLKIEPTREQIGILDRTFWRWASICTRVSYGKDTIKELSPLDSQGEMNFSKTQLHMANTQVADLAQALKKQAQKVQQRIDRMERSLEDITEAIATEQARATDPKSDKFTIKKWLENSRRLKNKYYPLSYWTRREKEETSRIKRTEQTLKKIESGRMSFKPTQIRVWDSPFQINMGEGKISIKLFEPSQPSLELKILKEPLQPSSGSSEKSRLYFEEGLKNFLVYTLDHSLLGLGRSKMLLNAKKPEAIAKKEAMLKQKAESEGKKIHEMEKMIGRGFSDEERRILELEFAEKIKTISQKLDYTPREQYSNLIRQFADELLQRNAYFCPNKYVMLVRKPINKFKLKKLLNLKPFEWEYFLQLSYEQLYIPKIKAETIMGINRGIADLFALSIIDANNNPIASRLIGNKVYGWKKYRRQLLNSIQNLERSTRANKNIHLPENQLKKKLRHIENKIKSEYHLIGSEIVKLAEENKSTIVFETIEKSGIKQHGRSRAKRLKKLNYVLSNFNYAGMAQLIAQKAIKKGLPVKTVLPGYISVNCSRCLFEGLDSAIAEENYYRYEDNKRNSKLGYCKEHTNNLSEAKTGQARCCDKWMVLTYKTGHCKKHGFIDADINAARVVAYCNQKGFSSEFAIKKDSVPNL